MINQKFLKTEFLAVILSMIIYGANSLGVDFKSSYVDSIGNALKDVASQSERAPDLLVELIEDYHTSKYSESTDKEKSPLDGSYGLFLAGAYAWIRNWRKNKKDEKNASNS
jgi:hypothetical protein